jgi:rSAM/selenodomain-associated transferase 2
VLQETQRIARTLGLRVFLLGPVQDVDRPEDLPVWDKVVRNYPGIRIVIPALNEEETLAGCLSSTRESFRVKVTVVDGGSSDRTAAIARSFGARVLNSAPGRGRQMNLGARTAREEILLFLHADTRLSEGFDATVREILARPGTVGGAFRLALEKSRSGLRVIEGLANWRSRWLQFPYGDQALFVRAKLFHHIGGFPEVPIMEDFEFIRRLRRKGRIVTAPCPAVSSARRWVRLGILKTTLVNQLMILGYYAGVSPSRLVRWYRRWEPGSPQRPRDR